MKEYSEIEISNSTIEIESIVSTKEFLVFRFEDRTLGRMCGGVPVELVGQNVVKFETQGYYERIPLDKTFNKPSLEIYKTWKRKEKIGDGVLVSRYFEKAEKGSFSTMKEMDLTNCLTIELPELSFSNQEKYALALGMTPLSMDDKWCSFIENDTLHYYRSWTGIELFRGKLIQSNNGNWSFSDIKIPSDNILELPDERLFYLEFIQGLIKHRLNLLGL